MSSGLRSRTGVEAADPGASARADPRLFEALAQSLSSYWRQRQPYQTFLYVTGSVLLASGLVHGVLWGVTGDSWTDPVSWRKPTLFGISFGLTALSLAWVHTHLRPHPRLGWLVCGSFGVAAMGEVALISLQRWRRVPSHFNTGTAFDATVFQLMGLLVAVVALGIIAVTVQALTSVRAAPSMRLAVRGGLLLLVAGQVLGQLILVNGATVLHHDPGANLAQASVLGAAGQMKVPHAVALHAIQVLPALAWLLSFTSLVERVRLRLVVLAAAGYTGLLLVNVAQTFRGLAPLALNIAALATLLLSLTLLLGTGIVTLVSLLRPRPPSRTSSTPPAEAGNPTWPEDPTT
ncbi:MAG TPA: hypothetical protein VF635_15520 [Propionibacteriaceae bacterium]